MGELSLALGRPASLDDIPDAELDRLAQIGFAWIWLLGVWQTGAAARAISRSNAGWRAEYLRALPDLVDEDIAGSPFAIVGYTVAAALGGDAALKRLRGRMHARGLRLMLDFIPNHTAPDHPWVTAHPEYFIAREGGGFAYGRDPNYPGWPDTVQLNYAHPDVPGAMLAELAAVAARCDGVRCDMAMLLLPEVFKRTWGLRAPDFWPRATAEIHRRFPGFLFVAEVYWDLEYTLQRQGFDYTYDKRLYDRLRAGDAAGVREHLRAPLDFQNKLVRFLENHDEDRAAQAFPPAMHRAAAVAAFFSPGLRLFQRGQLEGCRARISVHLGRGPVETADAEIADFYRRLLECLRHPAAGGNWRLLACPHPAFIAFACGGLTAIVNYGAIRANCRVALPWPELRGKRVALRDLFSGALYRREGDELAGEGLYVDLPAWGFHLLAIESGER